MPDVCLTPNQEAWRMLKNYDRSNVKIYIESFKKELFEYETRNKLIIKFPDDDSYCIVEKYYDVSFMDTIPVESKPLKCPAVGLDKYAIYFIDQSKRLNDTITRKLVEIRMMEPSDLQDKDISKNIRNEMLKQLI